MYKSTVTLVLFSIIVALVNAQCSCQTKPPVGVIYKGEACECSRKHPIQIDVPKITEHRDAHYDYGFTIERPQQPPAEVKYTFDFHMEKPKPVPTEASLATYGFEVQTPAEKEPEVPQRYKFDYQVQKPIVQSEPSTLQGLLAHVDRVVVTKPDCEEKTGCHCNSYKPSLELLQSCPKHGHLYRSGGALYPNQQRYNKDSSYSPPQTPDQIPTPSERTKRDVATTFPIKIQEMLPVLRANNVILKAPSVETQNQNRKADILKKNFGEDPSENMEELLRPKPLKSSYKFEGDVEKDETTKMAPATPDFMAKIHPKLQEARSNLRRRLTKIVNKARYNAIRANHLIQKRSAEKEASELSEVFSNNNGNSDVSYEPMWIANESVEGNLEEPVKEIGLFESEKDYLEGETVDRVRKHCDRCGELAKKIPCPSCVAMSIERTQPQNVETKHEIETTYVAGEAQEHLSQPKYVFGRFDDDDVTVGSYQNGAGAYGELQHILDKNSDAMHSQNRRIHDGHSIQPMNFEHATDAIRFIQELTQKNNLYDENYNSNVGAGAQNSHAKRSFKIERLAENNDGSVFVKISPVKPYRKLNNNKLKEIHRSSEENESHLDVDGTELSEINFSTVKPKANFKKFVRNGKNFEILALSPNGSEEGFGSGEDVEILKYVYAVNQKDQDNTEHNEFSETIVGT